MQKNTSIHSGGWCGFKPSDYGNTVRAQTHTSSNVSVEGCSASVFLGENAKPRPVFTSKMSTFHVSIRIPAERCMCMIRVRLYVHRGPREMGEHREIPRCINAKRERLQQSRMRVLHHFGATKHAVIRIPRPALSVGLMRTRVLDMHKPTGEQSRLVLDHRRRRGPGGSARQGPGHHQLVRLRHPHLRPLGW